MNTTEAIKQLQQIKANKQQQSSDNTSNAMAKSLNTFKTILVSAMCDLTEIIVKNEPSVRVLNVPNTKKVERELVQINKTLLLLLKEIKSQKKED